jgi:ABC-type glycerol-3-phosphate transport system substrate-binding protein
MNKIMKRVLAGVASAALALTGLVGGAATASATEPTYPHTVTDNETLTFTADEEQ